MSFSRSTTFLCSRHQHDVVKSSRAYSRIVHKLQKGVGLPNSSSTRGFLAGVKPGDGSQTRELHSSYSDIQQLNHKVATPYGNEKTLEVKPALPVGNTSSLYSQLNEEKDEIRLITFLKTPHQESQPLECKLETVSLASFTPLYQKFISESKAVGKRKQLAGWLHESSGSTLSHDYPTRLSSRFTWGDYSALSYVWGEANPLFRRTIILNNKAVKVGKNLEIALRNLSSSPEFQGQDGHKLWVDALCINQIDTEERNRQVARMRNIYGDAFSVIAWIGEEADESGKALELLHELANASKGELGGRYKSRVRKAGWMALHDLFMREYWFRLWIIQEVVLGRTILHCGNHSISWEDCCLAVGFLFDYLWTMKDVLREEEMRSEGLIPGPWFTTRLHLIRQDLWTLSYYEEQGTGRLSFAGLLEVAGSANSTDHRDQVYGLVGMMDPLIAASLHPDYSQTAGKVYADVARLYIEKHGNLDPLREGSPWGIAPSWAADWSRGDRIRHSRLESGASWTQSGPPQATTSFRPYRASGSTTMKTSFSEDGLRLTCKGFIIDKVDGLSARGSGYFAWSLDSIVQPKNRKSVYGSNEKVSEAIWRTLIGDRGSDRELATDRHAALLQLPPSFELTLPSFKTIGWEWFNAHHGHYFRWEIWRRINKSFIIGDQPIHDYFTNTNTIPENSREKDFKNAFSCYDRMCKNRRLMTTEKGYLGWGPDNVYGTNAEQMRAGDLIVVLFGCNTPLVVRPCDEPCSDMFQVVGEAYVHGLMGGEAVEGLASGEYCVEDFVFC